MREERISCLDCGAPFDEEDVNRTYTSENDRCIIECTGCGARNELRADRMPGLAEPPRAVVVRVVRAGEES